MRPWLEGRTPARRPHHAMELAAIVMSRTSCSEVVFCLGGLAAVKSYVNGIEMANPLTAMVCTQCVKLICVVVPRP